MTDSVVVCKKLKQKTAVYIQAQVGQIKLATGLPVNYGQMMWLLLFIFMCNQHLWGRHQFNTQGLARPLIKTGVSTELKVLGWQIPHQ